MISPESGVISVAEDGDLSIEENGELYDMEVKVRQLMKESSVIYINDQTIRQGFMTWQYAIC